MSNAAKAATLKVVTGIAKREVHVFSVLAGSEMTRNITELNDCGIAQEWESTASLKVGRARFSFRQNPQSNSSSRRWQQDCRRCQSSARWRTDKSAGPWRKGQPSASTAEPERRFRRQGSCAG